MKVTIKECIQRKAGETRYCNCESTKCDHGDDPCLNGAKVVATVECPAYGSQTMQLCDECLRNYRSVAA